MKINWHGCLRTLAFIIVASQLAMAVLLLASQRSDDIYFRDLGEHLTLGTTTQEERVEAVLRWVAFNTYPGIRPDLPPLQNTWAQLYYRYSPFRPDARSVVELGSDYRGPCGSRSRVLRELLTSVGIDAKRTLLHDSEENSVHTVVLAKMSNGWVPLDPTYNLIFRQPNGRFASVQEVGDNMALFQKSTEGLMSTGPDGSPKSSYWKEYTYQNVYNFNWKKGKVVEALYYWGRRVVGENKMKQVSMPVIYTRPKSLFAYCLLVLISCELLLIFAVKAGRNVISQKRIAADGSDCYG